MQYKAYHKLKGFPNIIVDGSPTDNTVLSLSHWKGVPTPEILKADVAAAVTFNYLSHPELKVDAEFVSNDHFDEDGLVSVFTLVYPEYALRNKELLIGIANAGDFGIYTDLKPARLSFIISSYSSAKTSPLDSNIFQKKYNEQCEDLYNEMLLLVPEFIENTEKFKIHYEKEENFLLESEFYFQNNFVQIEELKDLDLAILRISPEIKIKRKERVANLLHPMSIHNRTRCFKILLVCENEYELYYRYESWVDYISEKHPPRIDLHDFRWDLNLIENGFNEWRFTGVNAIISRLKLKQEGGSSINEVDFIGKLKNILYTS
ncbi:MAG: hypothetical protein KBA66_07210 [Leptospiraceae bacterium]|nr:hypothetical protein [Leptospiraceae bacterium]